MSNCCCSSEKSKIQQVSTKLSFADIIGSWKARWGINRMNYKVSPGIYAVGNPDMNSPVLVTANYKMTFDMLRKELTGLNTWILVLDTKGVNVWCAAGKGTFGTDELIRRIGIVKLNNIVNHKNIILPQLAAPGVAAHQVTKATGFKIIYGPIRAADILDFIKADYKATTEMRTVRFGIIDRLVLTPIELVSSAKIALIYFGVLFILNNIGLGNFGFVDFYSFIGATFIGCVLTPILLPFIPVRAFALKGWILGFLWVALVSIISGWPSNPEYGIIKLMGYLLALPAVSAFYAMNFTGASTYTSLSGVLKEMKIAVPAITVSIAVGFILILASNFLTY